MKVLVTGGAGFIGANFVHRARRDPPRLGRSPSRRPDLRRQPATTSRRSPTRSTFVQGSIADADLVDALVADTDVVVHFAAESHNDNSLDDPWPFMESNIIGTYRLLEAVRRHDVRLHHISTDEVYGDLELDDPARFTEQTPVNPSSPYSATQGQRRPAGARLDPLVRHRRRRCRTARTTTARTSTSRSSSRARSPASCRASSPSLRRRRQRPRLDPRRRPQRRRHRRSSSRAGSARPTSSAPTASRTTARSSRCCSS